MNAKRSLHLRPKRYHSHGIEIDRWFRTTTTTGTTTTTTSTTHHVHTVTVRRLLGFSLATLAFSTASCRLTTINTTATTATIPNVLQQCSRTALPWGVIVLVGVVHCIKPSPHYQTTTTSILHCSRVASPWLAWLALFTASSRLPTLYYSRAVARHPLESSWGCWLNLFIVSNRLSPSCGRWKLAKRSSPPAPQPESTKHNHVFCFVFFERGRTGEHDCARGRDKPR